MPHSSSCTTDDSYTAVCSDHVSPFDHLTWSPDLTAVWQPDHMLMAMWAVTTFFGFLISLNQDAEGLRVGVANLIDQWVKGQSETSRQSLCRVAVSHKITHIVRCYIFWHDYLIFLDTNFFCRLKHNFRPMITKLQYLRGLVGNAKADWLFFLKVSLNVWFLTFSQISKVWCETQNPTLISEFFLFDHRFLLSGSGLWCYSDQNSDE